MQEPRHTWASLRALCTGTELDADELRAAFAGFKDGLPMFAEREDVLAVFRFVVRNGLVIAASVLLASANVAFFCKDYVASELLVDAVASDDKQMLDLALRHPGVLRNVMTERSGGCEAALFAAIADNKTWAAAMLLDAAYFSEQTRLFKRDLLSGEPPHKRRKKEGRSTKSKHYAVLNGLPELGATPFLQALQQNFPPVIRLFFEAPRLDAEARLGDGRTALHIAAERGALPVVKRLLEHHRASVNSVDAKGNTPMHSAVHGGEQVLDALLCEKTSKASVANKDGQTPLHVAAHFGKPRAVKRLLNRREVLPDPRDNEGSTPLHYAVAASSTEVIGMLIKAGAKTYVVNNEGETPLHWITPRLSTAALGILAGAEPLGLCRADKGGFTPLHVVCNDDNLEAALVLVAHGADVEARDNEGQTPGDLFSRVEYTQMICGARTNNVA